MAVPVWLERLARPEDIRTIRTAVPGYEQNRERGAVIIKKAFAAHDVYVKAQPFIFGASLLGAIAAGYAWQRRRRHAEAHVLYPGLLVALGGVAWLTRPRGTADGCPPPGTPAESGEASPFLVYLDKEVAREKAQDRRFADKVYQRLVGTCAARDMWSQTPPYLKAVLI